MKYVIATMVIITILVSGCANYNQTNISIWGYKVSSNKLKSVWIDTKEHQYMVTNPKLVLELANEISRLKKLNEIIPNNFPPIENNSGKFTKLLVQDVHNEWYGGSVWDNGSNKFMDGSGYYWEVSNKLIDLMDKSIKNSKNRF